MEGASPRRLLVLDDDELVGVLVETIGRLAGLHTRLTADHAAFFLALQEFRPDLIFLDLTMPAMAGEDVLRGLAHLHCTARVIISSGASAERLVDAAALARQCGLATAGTLVKPFTPADLRALLVW
jgi:CheY-like chemotaxis protein